MRLPSLLSCFKPRLGREGHVHSLATDPDQQELEAQAPATQRNPSVLMERSPSVECPLYSANDWLEALPCSWAVVTSDAHKVLHHHLGQEPAAAQICSRAIQLMSSSSNSSSHPVPALGSQSCAKPVSEGAPSFLAMLLGPQLEAAALKRTQMGRPWKGTICVQLPAAGHTSGSSDRPVCPGSEQEARRSPTDPSCLPHDAIVPSAALYSTHTSTPAPAAVEEAEEQRVKESATCQGTKAHSDRCPRLRQPGCKGGVRFQVAGRDGERSCGGVEEDAKGSQWDRLSSGPGLKPYDSSAQLGWKGHPDHPSVKSESNHKLEAACSTPSKPRRSLDCTAHLDTGIHAGEEDMEGQVKPERNVLSTRSSTLRRRLRRSASQSSAPGDRSRKSSLQMSEGEVEQLLREGWCESPMNLHTMTFLKSLSQAEYPHLGGPARHRSSMPDLDRVEHIAQHDGSCSALPHSATLEANIKNMDKTSASRNVAGTLPQPQPGSIEGPTNSFDIVVSLLDHSKGKRSPLMIMISNSTEHLKARAILTALAESQLELLANIMPQHAIQFLAMESSEAVPEHVGQLARAHKSATLMFMDICGFTSMSKEVEPVQVMAFLNTLFSQFDKLVDIHGVHKVETAGDCYIVSGGIMKQAADGFNQVLEERHDPAESAHRVLGFAKAILDVASRVPMPNTQQPVCIRIGMHTGDVVSGIIGTKLPKFSLFGDAMNTASRMESTGVPGRIHVSEATRNLLPQEEWEATGGVEVKGKGLMESYLWIPRLGKLSDSSQHHKASPSIPQSPGLGNAQQSLPGPTSPFPALGPAIHLLCSPRSSHAVMPFDLLHTRERGWEQVSGQQFLHAMTSIPESNFSSKIIRTTQSLYLFGRGSTLPPALSPTAPAQPNRMYESF